MTFVLAKLDRPLEFENGKGAGRERRWEEMARERERERLVVLYAGVHVTLSGTWAQTWVE